MSMGTLPDTLSHLSHLYRGGTMGQAPKSGTNCGTSTGQTSLKALAHKVLQRDKAWDKGGTSCPTGSGTKGGLSHPSWDKDRGERLASLPPWPGPHCDGRPYCEWLPGIEQSLPGKVQVRDLQGYGIPSTGVPISVQAIASCGWRVVVDAGGKLDLASGPTGAILQSVCRRELEANADTIKKDLTAWQAWE